MCKMAKAYKVDESLQTSLSPLPPPQTIIFFMGGGHQWLATLCRPLVLMDDILARPGSTLPA